MMDEPENIKVPSLEEAAEALRRAAETYQARKEDKEAASRAETAALNTLNDRQKAFDAAVDRTRKTLGHSGSDWSTKMAKGVWQ